MLIGIPHLYIWSHADAVAKSHVLQHKAPYLNTPAFLIRAAIYFAVWLLLWCFSIGAMSRSHDDYRRLADRVWWFMALSLRLPYRLGDVA